jgi:CYTH domain-containing protein
MGVEIERKFLVTGTEWKTGDGVPIRQGYLNRDKERTIRVRIAGLRAFIAIKGITRGSSRAEFEYEIPVSDAEELLPICEGMIIEKTRYTIAHAGSTWEIDEFSGANSGLVIAEIELQSVDEVFRKPLWLGKEVTDDVRYYNANLSLNGNSICSD